MGEVVNLDDYRPQVQADMWCPRCSHEWTCQWPAHWNYLSCPECEVTFEIAWEDEDE